MKALLNLIFLACFTAKVRIVTARFMRWFGRRGVLESERALLCLDSVIVVLGFGDVISGHWDCYSGIHQGREKIVTGKFEGSSERSPTAEER